MRAAALTLAALLATAPAARAHDQPRRGPNGGTVVDAGSYHVEVVASGAVLDVFVSDEADKPVPAVGFKGTAILTVDGKAQRISLEPADGTRLTGKAGGPLPATPKGAVQLTAPDGKTAQGRLN